MNILGLNHLTWRCENMGGLSHKTISNMDGLLIHSPNPEISEQTELKPTNSISFGIPLGEMWRLMGAGWQEGMSTWNTPIAPAYAGSCTHAFISSCLLACFSSRIFGCKVMLVNKNKHQASRIIVGEAFHTLQTGKRPFSWGHVHWPWVEFEQKISRSPVPTIKGWVTPRGPFCP